FQDRVPRRTADADAYLAALHADEQRKRRSRFATRARSGAGRTTVTAERFVARKRDTWERFHHLAILVEQGGVSRLPAGDIPAFAAPGGIGYGLIRAHPELQDELVTQVMVSRARQAAENQARGIGYAESPKEELPVVASTIMSNNIGIGFWAFVGGLLLGLPTV